KRNIQVAISQLSKYTGSLDAELRTIPTKERVMLDITRQQNIKQELYLFLLKKREETAIAKSSTIANARIIDPAQADRIPFSPKRQLFYLSAFIIVLILPGAILYLREMMNVRIITKHDITDRTSAHILAEISHSEEDTA